MSCALPAALYHAASPVSRTYLISFALERGLLRDDNDCRGCCGSSVLLCEGFKRDSAIECDSDVSSSQLAQSRQPPLNRVNEAVSLQLPQTVSAVFLPS